MRKKQNQTETSGSKRRTRGRPQTLADPVTTTIRIERQDLEALDRWATEHDLSRSQAAAAAIRALSGSERK